MEGAKQSKPKLVLTSTGISVARPFDRYGSQEDAVFIEIKGKPTSLLDERRSEIASLRQRLIHRLHSLDLDTREGLNASSAEIKSLKVIGVCAADHIIFFATETADGKLCTDVVAHFINDAWRCYTDVKVIEGLQVHDAELFEKKGVKNYLWEIIKILDKHRYTHDIILNPTGGFKSVVPYTTILGMMYQLPSQYIFEFSDSLLTLPAIPLEYNYELIEKQIEKFEKIDAETTISQKEFWHGIPFHERSRYEPLLDEVERGFFTLSSIGILVFGKYCSENPPPIPDSTQRPDEKDGLSGKEPNRTAKFNSFVEKLKRHNHVNYFRYKRGCNLTQKKVAIIEHGVLEASYEAIVLEVQTTATHPKHNEIIRDEIQTLMT